MIVGIGSDLCSISRVEKTLARYGDRFIQRCFTPLEQRKSEGRAQRAASYAKRFAAKEAFSKAIGLGLHTPMTWRDCEILNLPSGQPQIRLHGALADWFDARRLRAHVSLTDETDYATSFVVVESEP